MLFVGQKGRVTSIALAMLINGWITDSACMRESSDMQTDQRDFDWAEPATGA